ncbi:helicase with zinc finger domain 2 [Triplophysa rosa]|uniref:Helicase with zinc finger domain 2 n=1 Tax=Triplophysa rosa TaxID=992332 RepID=A0A9W7WTJ5_TRIRA|nr:helicase with zinc finger domain 2 [Triplophysa rosa]KAI7808056.1 putative helicase with zinc finger domain 2 [Triplophysa rosa]
MALTGLTFCKLCSQHFSTEEELMNHCFTVEHRKQIFEDTSSQWKHRCPAQSYKDLKLCDRSQTCEYGDNCLKAHSKEELKEWKKRVKAACKRAQDAADQGLLSYQDRLLEEYRHSKDKERIVSDIIDTPDVKVTCDTDSDCVFVRQIGISCTWNFTITSKEPLEVVALLRQDAGATFTLNKDPRTKQTYSMGDWFLTRVPKVYDIAVSFTSDQPGLYEQWLIFDFNMRPVLRQKLRVNVGKDIKVAHCCEETSDLTPAPEVLQEPSEPPTVRIIEPWNEENVKIVPFSERAEAERALLNKYKLFVKPQMNRTMTHENYKESMHMFLYQEEKEEGQLLARLNQQGSVQLTDNLFDLWFGLKCALPGELFAVVHLSHPFTPDTPQGYIMKRHSIKALVQVVDSDAPIYEVALLKDAVTETQVHLQLSKQCCTDLVLQNKQKCEMEVQFQLSRLWFCEMHKAIDDLRDLDKVLPDLKNHTIHISNQSDTGDLNEQQKAAMNFILSTTDNTDSVPPLLIYGPFGTGKTMTLANMARTLVQQPQNKILICTHTNSSADLYVEKHFHKYVTDHPEVRPLRIKAMEKSQQSTDHITRQYCHLSKDGHYFEFPDKAVLDSTRIIITTTSMARYFLGMRLPENYFSHILIDEASQMLECEALMALGLAGKTTHVVLAGDHMQMGPKLFSVTQEKCSDHTLLNRLFYHYQAENSTAAKQSRIIFSENYRSTKDIVDFLSEHFYEMSNQRDVRVIKARGNVPSHPEQHALQFHHVRGECHLDPTSMSWFNAEEIQSVVDIVQEIMRNWPTEWHDQDPASICVLSQGRQVNEIRKRLKRRNITVENAENVQGKQFRVIVISTVHTKDSLLETNLSCLEFFNDRRVLNTVMTRAQSQIVVVGDAAALSHFGTCCRLWMSYVEHCIHKGSAHHLVENFWKQDLLELSKLSRSEDEDSSDSESTTSEISNIDDPILKELLDNEDINIPLTDEGLFPVLQNELVRNYVDQIHEGDSSLPRNNSSVHKCELAIESFWKGYARSLDDPTVRIAIKGRKNMGHSFPGDKVEVEITNHKSNPPMGKVIQVLESADTLKEFVCTIEKHDRQVMTPINPCICKIFTPFWKDKPNHIAVRNPQDHTIQRFIKINEETHRNYLFVVRVLKWRKDCVFPLGIVVGLFPKIKSLEDGLKVLDIEFQLRRALPSAVEREMHDFQGLQVFEDGREDFRGLSAFTIDSDVSEDLDDAISVRDLGECYEIGVHISDIASYVSKDSELDKYARQQCTTFYSPEREPTHMFPKELSVKFFSLIPDCDRRAISLMSEVDKNTYRIKRRYFVKSVIRSKRRFSYGEAEDILKKVQHFDPLEVCLVIACYFADVHRKYRKQEDWCYKAPDEDVPLGRRRSHRIIEELMIMFNHTVADRLLFDATTRSLTPVRCQEVPKFAEVEDLLDKNASLVPLSAHLSCQADSCKTNSHTMRGQRLGSAYSSIPNLEVAVSETFPILVSLLECLRTAAQDRDIYSIIDFITTDDIHPQLLPIAIAFRKLFQRAYFLRSNSTHTSRIGHCDLDLDSYTWASSPIRRYIDVIVQRLLHSVIDKTDVSYTSNDIHLSCLEFSRKNDNQSAYDKKVHALHFASKLSIRNERKVAYIVELTPSGNNFRVSFPLNRDSMPTKTEIMYRDLQLADQPQVDDTNSSMILKWVRRIYSFSNPDIHAEVKQQNPNTVMAYVSTEAWKCLVAALRDENWELMFSLIDKLASTTSVRLSKKRLTQGQHLGADKFDPIQDHYVELSLRLKQGDAVEVQLGTSTIRGLLTPAVQLFAVHPKFEICLEHVKDPIKCFSKYASHSSRNSYNTYMDYQATWAPICEMESVTSAVAENESIVLEDVPLKWETSQPEKLQGFFLLPLNKKAQWSIESDLKKCYLCIRSRIHKNQGRPYLENSQCADLMNIQTIIWVAHGVITEEKKSTTEEKRSKLSENLQINFRINHMPMTKIPDVIFCESTRFTVELVPKLLPDVRKENALASLTKANQLVKNIAIGRRISSESGCTFSQGIRTRFEINNYLPSGFHLNESQCTAIRKALVNPFTLIQGPPGTGKTVVGVHIVYWLLEKIQKLPTAQKKRAILYCGPSNKSVDVVAGHLLKLQKELRPLRVYSDQVEMLEFPYPGCNLKLSRHSKRVEKPNTDLSSIALHHLIRKHTNPSSAQIQAFDMKIQRGDQLTKEEMKCYKDVLQKARKHELLRHDVILCTCTAASQPALADALDLKQIIIDECAMATEPEASIPLVAHKPEQIVLLGDHMQLQPVVHCDVAARLGMNTSLFERYMENALMLDVQYRMQKDICAFPSKQFYDDMLNTYKPHKPGLFLNEFQGQTSIIFGHVEGKERSLVVSTEHGNENSKANEEEAKETVRIARLLIRTGVQRNDIAVLTPYNAQVVNISETLRREGVGDVIVNTIMKSQGSEWKYVILSTVRSCPESDIEPQPTKSWITNRLGFIMDPHQLNVAITRAQEGLCIIGNENLLRCSTLWRNLLDHYQTKRCVVNPASKIQVRKPM